MDRLNIGRISSKKMDMLQDLSVDFSQLVKKYIKNLKKLSSKDQKAFGKLFGDFKDGLDDLSTNESVNESVNLNEGTRSQVGIIDKGGKIQSAYVHFDGYPSNMKSGIKKHIKNEKDVLKLIKKGGARGIYNDKDIEYYNEKPNPIKGDVKDKKKYVKLAGSNGGAEFVYLYDMRDKKWYFADVYGFGKNLNDLKPLYESLNEVDTKKADTIRKSMPGYVGPKFAKKASDEDILAMADLKDEKAKIYNRYLKDVMGKISKLQKKYNIKESVNEAEEPEIITQLRKGGYQTLKDPQTGKKVKIDNYSSSAIVAVYDALKKDKVKEKFANLPLLKMANVAFKAMK